jgi:16S rRNA (cytosine967-C5)-methyltransferase
MNLSFDGVLVDAPCSGVGTWQRNPDSRWTTTPQDVAELAVRQLSLLRSAARAVKPGGRLVYAVCSLTRSETSSVAAEFSATAPDFSPATLPAAFHRGSVAANPGQLWIWPQDWRGNGMFVAVWRRQRQNLSRLGGEVRRGPKVRA